MYNIYIIGENDHTCIYLNILFKHTHTQVEVG